MVHLCAPTTYAKQDKQLCDSKINDFKHEGYHKVKCISKSSGIEITEAHGDDDVLPSSSQGSMSRWRGVMMHNAPQTPLEASPYSPVNLATTGLVHLQCRFLQGGTEAFISSLRHAPQLNWRLPRITTKATTV